MDSFYINQLLRALQEREEGAIERFDKEIQMKDPLVQPMYEELKNQLIHTEEPINVIALKEDAIQDKIRHLTENQAQELGLSIELLQSAANEYRSEGKVIPYLSHLLDTMTLSKEAFEEKTGEKYRRRTKVLEQLLQKNFDIIQKWKEEL